MRNINNFFDRLDGKIGGSFSIKEKDANGIKSIIRLSTGCVIERGSVVYSLEQFHCLEEYKETNGYTGKEIVVSFDKFLTGTTCHSIWWEGFIRDEIAGGIYEIDKISFKNPVINPHKEEHYYLICQQ